MQYKATVLVSVMASMIISEAQSIPDAKTLGPSSGPSISIDDVDRFYHVYDAGSLAKHPEMYSNARGCANVLPHARQRVAVALQIHFTQRRISLGYL